MADLDLTHSEAQARAALITVSSYEVGLDLTLGPEAFGSTTVISFTAAEVGAATFVEFAPSAVHEIVLNGRRLDPGSACSGGRILLDDLAASNELRVDAECAYSDSGTGLHRMTDPADGQVYVYTHLQVAHARRVFASFDQPDLKAEFSFTVTAPAGWRVFSTSPSPQPGPAGAGTQVWRFAPTPAISTYAASVVAGPFHVVGSVAGSAAAGGREIPIAVACRRSLAEYLDAAELLDIVTRSLDYYVQVLGPYPFGKFDLVFVPGIRVAAMENAACVTVNEMYVFRSKATSSRYERRAGTIAHELSHMWFGDLVTMTWWNDLWLNESFAGYAAGECLTAATRWTGIWTMFTNVEKTWSYEQDQLPTTHPVAADINDVQDVEVNFDGITYNKGASVLQQLASFVGSERFFAGVRLYLDRYGWGNASLPELLACLSEASGRDLSSWRSEWLESAGTNVLRSDFTLDGDGRFASFEVVQESPPEHPVLRSHRIAIGLYDLTDAGLTRVGRIDQDVVGARTAVPELTGRRQPDLVLLNDEDLTYARIRFDQRSLATLIGHIGEFDAPLQRALCWYAAWDMAHNAEMRARDFLSMILSGASRESDTGVVEVLQRRARTAVLHLADPAWRLDGLALLADSWRDQLELAEPGSDFQLAWARAFADVAHRADDLSLIAGLLDGSRTIPGLAIDTDLRWTLLTALVTNGAAGEEQIKAELVRDKTATGERQAEKALAARPDPDAKAVAWESIMAGTDRLDALGSSTVAGFCSIPADRLDLLRPYVRPYFAAIGELWESRGPQVARGVVESVFAALPVEQETVSATDAFLAEASPAPALRRLLLESRDFMVRALRAQDLDRAGAE